jgi:hypothetical protein
MAITTLPVVTECALPGETIKTNLTLSTLRVKEWPQIMRGDLAWDHATLPSEEDTILTLNEAEVEEVRDAVNHFNGRLSAIDVSIGSQKLTVSGLGLYGSEVAASNFPLPTLGQKLLKAALDVHRGRGFTIVRGLNPKEFSPEDNLIIFLGISSYIGSQRGRQDEDGNMLSML